MEAACRCGFSNSVITIGIWGMPTAILDFGKKAMYTNGADRKKKNEKRGAHILLTLAKLLKHKSPTYLYPNFKFLKSFHDKNTGANHTQPRSQ